MAKSRSAWPLALVSSLLTGVVVAFVSVGFIEAQRSDGDTPMIASLMGDPRAEQAALQEASSEPAPPSAAGAASEPIPMASRPAIRTTRAFRCEMVQTMTTTGSIEPRETAVAGTDVSGLTVMELNADVGDMVGKGDVLARLDASPLQIQRGQAVAERNQAEAQLSQSNSQISDAEVVFDQANEQTERQQRLLERGVSSQTTLDDAVFSRRSAQARLNSARQAMQAAQAQLQVIDSRIADIDRQLSKTEVRAPSDGLVLERNAMLGAIVSQGADPLFRLAVGGELELAADVPEADLPPLEPGMTAIINVPGLDQPFQARLRRVDPQIDRSTRLGSIRLTLTEPAALRTGSFARGDVEVVRREGIAVPSAAIVYQDGEPAVQKVDENGLVATVPVQLGIRDDTVIEIVEGLSEGDQVVSRAGTFVADGDHIRPVAEEQASATGGGGDSTDGDGDEARPEDAVASSQQNGRAQ